MDVEQPDIAVGAVLEGVLDPGRDENERARSRNDLFAVDLEDEFPLEHVERVVLGGVDVGGRFTMQFCS